MARLELRHDAESRSSSAFHSTNRQLPNQLDGRGGVKGNTSNHNHFFTFIITAYSVSFLTLLCTHFSRARGGAKKPHLSLLLFFPKCSLGYFPIVEIFQSSVSTLPSSQLSCESQ
ncbi:hypothetical protein ACFX2I_024554 [Malus domestica]